MKLVLYYSLGGETDFAAELLTEQLGADMLRIEMKKKMPSSNAGRLIVGGAMSVFDIRPDIKRNKINLEKYDTVIIGTPVWAGKCAAPMTVFLSANDLSNKTLYFFATSGGGNAESCFKTMEKLSAKPKAVLSLKSGISSHTESVDRVKEFAKLISEE